MQGRNITRREVERRMKKLRNKRVTKMRVKDLINKLQEYDEDSEVVLGFYLKDQPNHFVYLADTCNVSYDGVIKEKLFNGKVVELMGYDHQFCSYVERKDER